MGNDDHFKVEYLVKVINALVANMINEQWYFAYSGLGTFTPR